MSKPPAVVIELPIESAPVMLLRVASEAESDRLRDWIEASEDLSALFWRAVHLSAERPAA